MKNRIHIVNWRMHGDDESACFIAVYGGDDKTDATEEIERQVDPNYDWYQDDTPEDREDWDHVIYVNDDTVIADGEIYEHNGRKFRVSIQELK